MKYIFQILKESFIIEKENLRGVLITMCLCQVAVSVLSLFCPISFVFVILPAFFGLLTATLAFVREKKAIEPADLFAPLKSANYWKTLALFGWVALYTFLWSLLWVIPGVIKGLGYILAPFVLSDNPELSAKEAIKESTKLMKGRKWHLFVMLLIIYALVYVSLWFWGLPLFVVIPFAYIALAKFYNHVKAEANK